MFTFYQKYIAKRLKYSLLIVREAISSLLQFQAIPRYKNTRLQKKELFEKSLKMNQYRTHYDQLEY